MAAVPITIVGIETKDDGTSGQVTIVGMASLTGLGVGGGPSPGGKPPRPWGPINYPDQGLPGNQPYPDQGLPGNQPYPGQGLPGNQPYPGQGLPGNQPYPDQGLPKPPLSIWGGGGIGDYIDAGLPGLPPKPSEPPPDGGSKPPPPGSQGPVWCYDPDVGWYIGLVPSGGGGKPNPAPGF
jgi:hypothetical protein